MPTTVRPIFGSTTSSRCTDADVASILSTGERGAVQAIHLDGELLPEIGRLRRVECSLIFDRERSRRQLPQHRLRRITFRKPSTRVNPSPASRRWRYGARTPVIGTCSASDSTVPRAFDAEDSDACATFETNSVLSDLWCTRPESDRRPVVRCGHRSRRWQQENLATCATNAALTTCPRSAVESFDPLRSVPNPAGCSGESPRAIFRCQASWPRLSRPVGQHAETRSNAILGTLRAASRSCMLTAC